jgi:hypothetical protein
VSVTKFLINLQERETRTKEDPKSTTTFPHRHHQRERKYAGRALILMTGHTTVHTTTTGNMNEQSHKAGLDSFNFPLKYLISVK